MTRKLKRTVLSVVLLLLFRTRLSEGQSATIPNLLYDTNPLATDMLPEQKVGDTRAKMTRRADIIATAIQSFTLTLPAQFSCSPSPVTTANGSATVACGWNGSLTSHQFLGTSTGSTMGLFTLVASDLPALSASGGGHGAGIAPDPGSSAGTTKFLREDATWAAPPSGSVTSVGLTMPLWLTVTGSPVTGFGTIAVTNATGQASHQVIGTCNAATVFGPCSLVAGDIPAISAATQLTSTLAAAQFPALTGAVTTPAGSLATTLASSLTITTPVINKATIGITGTAGSSHIKTVGTAPTVSCTGTGTGGTAAVATGSTDLATTINITAGTSAGSSGTCTLTFNGTMTNNPICVATLVGASTWQQTSTVIQTTQSATAPAWTWANNNNSSLTALSNGSVYSISILCVEHN